MAADTKDSAWQSILDAHPHASSAWIAARQKTFEKQWTQYEKYLGTHKKKQGSFHAWLGLIQPSPSSGGFGGAIGGFVPNPLSKIAKKAQGAFDKVPGAGLLPIPIPLEIFALPISGGLALPGAVLSKNPIKKFKKDLPVAGAIAGTALLPGIGTGAGAALGGALGSDDVIGSLKSTIPSTALSLGTGPMGNTLLDDTFGVDNLGASLEEILNLGNQATEIFAPKKQTKAPGSPAMTLNEGSTGSPMSPGGNVGWIIAAVAGGLFLVLLLVMLLRR